MIAATNIITRNACLRYSESVSEEMNPIFAKANAITGNLFLYFLYFPRALNYREKGKEMVRNFSLLY